MAVNGNTARIRKCRSGADAVGAAKLTRSIASGERSHGTRRNIDDANKVVAGVCNVDATHPVKCNAQWLEKCRGSAHAISST